MKGQGTDCYQDFVISRFFFIYYSITWAKNIVRYTEDFFTCHLYASEKGKADPYKPVIPNTSEQFKRFLQPVL